MKLVLKSIKSDTHDDFKEWTPDDPSNVYEWLTVTIGVEGTEEGGEFKTLIATKDGYTKNHDDKNEFKGFVIQAYAAQAVEMVIKQFIRTLFAMDWEQAVEDLEEHFIPIEKFEK